MSQTAVPEKDDAILYKLYTRVTETVQWMHQIKDTTVGDETCDKQQDLIVHHHTPESSVFLSFSPAGADTGLLLPSAGRPGDSLTAAVAALDGEPSGTLRSFTLAGAGLLERLRLWLPLPLRCLRCFPLRGLGLRDLVFMRTTVLSSSELKSELSEELISRPEVGSWI